MLSQTTDTNIIANIASPASISYLRHCIVDHDGDFHRLTGGFLFGLGDVHSPPTLSPRKKEESLGVQRELQVSATISILCGCGAIFVRPLSAGEDGTSFWNGPRWIIRVRRFGALNGRGRRGGAGITEIGNHFVDERIKARKTRKEDCEGGERIVLLIPARGAYKGSIESRYLRGQAAA
jgi:hypothetical protein